MRSGADTDTLGLVLDHSGDEALEVLVLGCPSHPAHGTSTGGTR